MADYKPAAMQAKAILKAIGFYHNMPASRDGFVAKLIPIIHEIERAAIARERERILEVIGSWAWEFDERLLYEIRKAIEQEDPGNG